MQDMMQGPNLSNIRNQQLDEPIGVSNFVVANGANGTGNSQDEMDKLDSLIDDFQRASAKDE